MMDGYEALDKKEDNELDELEDELDDDFMRQYKAARMADLHKKDMNPKFGWVMEISKPEFKREVNEAPKGVFVCLLLYQEYIDNCQLMLGVIEEAAKKYE